MAQCALLLHNIRSTYNVGSIFRTADGFGVEKIILSGYTPYPKQEIDTRLPHLQNKITKEIHKTALGAESTVQNAYVEHPMDIINNYRQHGWKIIALEQARGSINLKDFRPPEKCLLILGEEVNGIAPDILQLADNIIEIPMRGQKESFNVAVATGIALYQITTVH